MDKYDFDVKNALELLLENGPNSSRDKNYIPDDLDLQRDIVKMFHDHKTAGHPGELETYNSVKQHYWWPGMRMFIK